MAGRSRSKRIRLADAQHRAAIEAEREKCQHMVYHFDRKGLQDTYWHKTLVRLDAVLDELKGDKEDG